MTRAEIDRLSCGAGDDPAVALRVFESRGVVVIRGALPPSVLRPAVARLQKALEDLEPLLDRYGIPHGPPPVTGAAIEALMSTRGEDVPPEDRHVLLGHYPLAVRLDDALKAIPLHLREMPALQTVVGSRDLFAHMPPTARYVLPGNVHAAVPAHQDVSYNRHLGRFRVMWVPLTEIDDRCGGMAVYPGTQTLDELAYGSDVAPADGWLGAVEVGGHPRVVLAPLSPGDVVLMDDHTVHESIANTSERVRISVDFRLFGAESHSSKHYLDLRAGTVVAPA